MYRLKATITIQIVYDGDFALPLPQMSPRAVAELLEIAAMQVDKDPKSSLKVTETIIQE